VKVSRQIIKVSFDQSDRNSLCSYCDKFRQAAPECLHEEVVEERSEHERTVRSQEPSQGKRQRGPSLNAILAGDLVLRSSACRQLVLGGCTCTALRCDRACRCMKLTTISQIYKRVHNTSKVPHINRIAATAATRKNRCARHGSPDAQCGAADVPTPEAGCKRHRTSPVPHMTCTLHGVLLSAIKALRTLRRIGTISGGPTSGTRRVLRVDLRNEQRASGSNVLTGLTIC